jgi:hypothetical protein
MAWNASGTTLMFLLEEPSAIKFTSSFPGKFNVPGKHQAYPSRSLGKLEKKKNQQALRWLFLNLTG